MIAALHLIVLALLAIYGLHRSHLVLIELRARRRAAVAPPPLAGELPFVTVQLPIYNESTVAARLIEAAAALRWPADRLEIQVLDDSADETSEVCAELIARLGRPEIHHLRRADRHGFKAGALAAGLAVARGDLLLVLDADFVPDPDLLERVVPHFSDAKVGMVQARWGHLNAGDGLLTRAQALLLDGHFLVENAARARAGRFFNFSGTAGVWRRQAIDDAGGWQHDTLTEDMDLSYRAQLAGWRFVFLPDVVVPAELPADLPSFRSQQFRWAKGQVQVARKLLPSVMRAKLAPGVKLEALLHLSANVTYVLLLGLCLLLVPTILGGRSDLLALDLVFFATTTAANAAFYAAARPHARARALLELPLVMALCAGICVSQARAVLEGLVGHQSEFVRTPKRGAATRARYRAPRSRLAAVELLLALQCAVAIPLAVLAGHAATLPFLVVFTAGFGYVGFASLRR
jgi:cellulose synthase/poly-beta-1,6-N-acetylglucosamine synthase-like glycosyltransferase